MTTIVALLLGGWLIATCQSRAQVLLESPVEGYTQGISVGGNVTATSEFYTTSGIVPRQPAFIQRVQGTVHANIFGIQTGASLLFSTEDNRLRQSLNAVNFHGRYRWITLSAGTFYPLLSPLIANSIQVLGAELRVEPNPGLLSIVIGQSRRAVEGDTTSKRPGVFRQMLYGVQLGWRFTAAGSIRLQGLFAQDDPTSLRQRAGAVPQRNLVLAMQLMTPVGSAITTELEGAISLFHRNIEADTFVVAELPPFFQQLFPPNFALTAGYALRGAMTARLTPVVVVGQVRYISPAFVSLGLGTQYNDVFELQFSPSLSMNQWSISGNFLIVEDNLFRTKITTARQHSVSLSGSVMIGKQGMLTASAMVYRQNLEPAVSVDTLPIPQTQNLTWSLTIAPSWTTTIDNYPLNMMVTVHYQQVQLEVQRTIGDMVQSQTYNLSVGVSKTLSVAPHTFSAGVGGNWTEGSRSWFANLGWIVAVSVGQRTLQIAVNANAYRSVLSAGRQMNVTGNMTIGYPVFPFLTVTAGIRAQWIQGVQQYGEVMGNVALIANW